MASTWALDKSASQEQLVQGLTRSVYRQDVPSERKIAESLLEFFSSTGPLSNAITSVNRSVQNASNTINGVQLKDQIDPNVYRSLKYQYANLYIATGVGSVGGTIDAASESVSNALNNASSKINETLKPVSSFIGSTLYTLTGVMKDPLGSVIDLPNTVGAMMDNLNPGLRSKYLATYKKYNVDKLIEMPGMIFGSAQQLVKSVDNILKVPIGLITDVYRGFQELIGKISSFIDSVFAGIQKFITNIIDGLFPGLTDFLTTFAGFVQQIGGIANTFGGLEQVVGFTNQIAGFANQINGFIQNPLDLAFQYAPPELSQGLYALQNPASIINQFLPPELSQYTQQLNSITGFGFNANMGYGLQSVLEGLQGGVLSSILQGFATQFSILSPLFTGQSVTPDFFGNETRAVPSNDGTTEYQTDPTSGTVAQVNPPRPNYEEAESKSNTTTRSTTTPASESGRGRFNARGSGGTNSSSRFRLDISDFEAYVVDNQGNVIRAASQAEINANRIIDPV
jgi:hypothetical protein